MNQDQAAPIVKWAGGKTRLLPELLARAPAKFNRYYEPFAGGAALYFRLAPERAVIGDANPDLINLYRVVSEQVERLIHQLATMRDNHHKFFYACVRDAWNDDAQVWTAVERAAAFVYLNKTCFNGLWRVNGKGRFNTPMGKYDNPAICAADGLRAASVVLARAALRDGTYQATTYDAAEGDFAYFDPPYLPATETANFTGYTAGGFGLEQHRELAAHAHALAARGCRVMISNADVPAAREIYASFRVDRVTCGRSIGGRNAAREPVGELIATA